MTEQKIWIVVKETLEPFKTLKEATATFDNLATFITTDSQIVCLTHNTKNKEAWAIEQVSLKEIANEMMVK